MNAADYRPAYDDSVIEWLQNDPRGRPPVSFNQFYCLMPTSARLLASLFSPVPEIFMAAPTPQAGGSPFAFNHLVPWFRFGTTERNAALLAQWWGYGNGPMPGVPYDQAMGYAEKDIAGLI
jgi:hypothetical protein